MRERLREREKMREREREKEKERERKRERTRERARERENERERKRERERERERVKEGPPAPRRRCLGRRGGWWEREFLIDNLLVRVLLIIEMILVDRPSAMEV